MATSLGIGSLSAQSGVQSSALQSSADRLIQQSRTGRPETDGAKIDKSAKDFEAILVGSWLQQAEQSFATVPGADEGQDVAKDSMMSLGVQTLSTAMASSGGFGIAKMVGKAMHAAADKTDSPAPAPAAFENAGKTPPSATLLHHSEKK
jgi:Rod binding domain-containing protein